VRRARTLVALAATFMIPFGCLALSAQSAVASTGPSVDRADVTTASRDAEALRTVVIAEKQIIAEGVQLVPQSAPLARRAEQLLREIANAASAVILDAQAFDSLGKANNPSDRAYFLDRMRNEIRSSLAWEAAARGITPPLVRFFSAPHASVPDAQVLRDLALATVAPLKSMAAAFELKGKV
jgi:hypothetical protein